MLKCQPVVKHENGEILVQLFFYSTIWIFNSFLDFKILAFQTISFELRQTLIRLYNILLKQQVFLKINQPFSFFRERNLI